jgi:predicted ATPase/DNA-binding CsgD family transcriptional regulator
MPRTDPMSAGNLPAELTSFVGRRREMGEVKRLLTEARLVTLTGAGGTGKTRLAIRAAAELRRAFRDGAWFVDLTAVRAPELLAVEVQDPDVVAYLVLLALGARERPGAGSSMGQLVDYLAGRQVLLVLDNCEHLVPVCAILTDALLRGCPSLRIVATSREPLLLTGEMIFPVPPLLVPDRRSSAAEVRRGEAVALFVARAQAVVPDFALTEQTAAVIGELCRRLDGLPLALELAAARARVLAPAQILDRLTARFALLSRGSRTAPARQQTLRACVDWSFELCSKPERVLWARLAVFAGEFELDAVEGVCADQLLLAEDVLDVLSGLVDKSILARDGSHGPVSRYRMLETIRDYGREKLVEAGEEALLHRRNRDWYQRLVRRAETDIISSRQPDWLARLERELPNLRAALDFSLVDPDGAEATLALATDLYSLWTIRGLQREGRSWLDQALARPIPPSMTLVKALRNSTMLAGVQGDLSAADMRVRQGHEVASQLGDPRAHAIATAAAGMSAMAHGDLVTAEPCWQRGLDGLTGEEGEEYLVWRLGTLTGLAMTKAMRGDVDGAAGCHEAILAICQPRGESWFSGYSLWTLGLGLWKQGDARGAAARLRESLRHLRRVNDAAITIWCLEALAWIAFDEARPEGAATLLGAATRLAYSMGTPPAVWPELAAHHEEYGQRARVALGEPAYRAAVAHGERLSLDEAVAYALDEDLRPPAAPPHVDTSASLTRRERQVADLVAHGLSNKEIAAKLVISQRTAESHVEHILAKLGFTSRAQVAAWITEHASGSH